MNDDTCIFNKIIFVKILINMPFKIDVFLSLIIKFHMSCYVIDNKKKKTMWRSRNLKRRFYILSEFISRDEKFGTSFELCHAHRQNSSHTAENMAVREAKGRIEKRYKINV